MKKSFICILLQIIITIASIAQQNVYTPKGHLVQSTYIYDEWTEEDRDSIDNFFAEEFPTATIIETYGGNSATKKFNCHGWAWHVSEGGDYVWIGSSQYNKDEEIYWTDYTEASYVLTTPDFLEDNEIAGKVSYGYFGTHDHSAVVDDVSYGDIWVIAKWGNQVLIRHKIDDCPYYDTDSLKYYRLYPEGITGSTSNLCYNVERDFNTNITKMPAGTLTWTKGNNLSIIGDDDEPEFTVKGGSSFGWSYVKLNINTQSGYHWESSPISFWTGVFNNTSVTGTAAVCPNSVYTYTAQVPGGHSPSYSYSWTYPSNWYNNGQNQNSIILQTPSSPYYGPVRVSITNQCGTSGYSGITTYPGYNCGGYYSMYPNPASDELTITINQPETIFEDVDISEEEAIKTISADQVTYTINIYNSLGTLVSSAVRTGTSFDIPLSKLRDGTYIVEISDGKNSYREQLIIKHD